MQFDSVYSKDYVVWLWSPQWLGSVTLDNSMTRESDSWYPNDHRVSDSGFLCCYEVWSSMAILSPTLDINTQWLRYTEPYSGYYNSYGVWLLIAKWLRSWLWIHQWLGSLTWISLWLWSLTPVTSMAMESDSGSLSASTIGRMFLRSTSSTSRSTARRKSPAVKKCKSLMELFL